MRWKITISGPGDSLRAIREIREKFNLDLKTAAYLVDACRPSSLMMANPLVKDGYAFRTPIWSEDDVLKVALIFESRGFSWMMSAMPLRAN